MSMKSKTILTITILLLSLFNSEPLHAQSLILWHSNGNTTEVELYTQPRVEFVNDKVLVTSPVFNLEYDKDDILRFTYEGKGTDISLPIIESDFEQKDGLIIFHDVKSVYKVVVYKVNGIRVPIQLSIQGKDAVLSLASIPSGVYLLSVNGRTSKFTKK